MTHHKPKVTCPTCGKSHDLNHAHCCTECAKPTTEPKPAKLRDTDKDGN